MIWRTNWGKTPYPPPLLLDKPILLPRVDTFEEKEEIDIDAVQVEMDALEKALVEVRKQLSEKLQEIQR